MTKRSLETLPQFIKDEVKVLRNEPNYFTQTAFKIYKDRGIEVQLVITRDSSEFIGGNSLFDKGESK